MHRTMLALFVGGLAVATVAGAADLPPAEDGAVSRLSASPRHGEWVRVDVGDFPVRVWVVHPERKDKAPVVVVIHEIFGLTDWIRAVADELAAAGFIAVAPDLLSGRGPSGGGTEAYADRDAARAAVSALDANEVRARLDAVRAYAIKLPSANGKSGAIGFCWGGTTSWAWATTQSSLDAAVVYYGTAPVEPARLASIHAPVLGLYGGDDARVTATVDATRSTMASQKRSFEAHVFDGAGHGFLRAQDGQNGANRTATEQAWPLTIAFLRRNAK